MMCIVYPRPFDYIINLFFASAYTGVGQTRTMEIVEKLFGLPLPVRITPTVRITPNVAKTGFFIRNLKLFFYKRTITASSSTLILICYIET